MVEYRQSARRKVEDSEQLDVPVRLTHPRGWMAVAAVAAVIVAGVLWGFLGTLPLTYSAGGVLAYPDGSFAVQTLWSGQVIGVLVKPGDVLQPGDTVARMAVNGEVHDVQTFDAGRVVSVPVQRGQVVQTGAPLAVGDRLKPDDKLMAVLYVPASRTYDIRRGADVDLSVESAPSKSFGVLRARVVSIDTGEDSYPQIVSFLGDSERAAQLTGGHSAVRVRVELMTAKTESGLAWSTKQGPPFSVGSRIGVVATVHETAIRPIDWVLP